MDSAGRLVSHEDAESLRAMGEPVRHDSVVAPCGLDGQGVELQELQGVVLYIVAWREVRAELDRPDNATEAASERNRHAVGDHAVGEGGAEVTPCGSAILDDAVVAILPTLDVHACVLRGSLHDLAVVRRRCVRCSAVVVRSGPRWSRLRGTGGAGVGAG